MKNLKTGLDQKVLEWWNNHPFTYNLDDKLARLTKKFFLDIDRKFRKWCPWGQADNQAMSQKIPYASLRGKQVLDIAIGTGWSTHQLAKAGAKVTAIDIAPEAVKLTKLRFKLFHLPKAKIMVGDGQDLQFPDNSFDYALAWGCLMHMPQTQKAIREIYRVLKPGGKAQAMMYNRNSLFWWYYIFFSQGILRGKLLKMNLQALTNRYTDGEKVGGNPLARVYSTREIRHLFHRFKSCHIETHDTYTPIDLFPHRLLPLGKHLPKPVKSYLLNKMGWLFWITLTK